MSNVPKLRFKEFSGEWDEKRYGDIYSFYSTNSYSRDNLNYENGLVKNIHYGDIHTRFKTLFNIKNENVPFINNDIDLSKIKSENYCEIGDLVIADASENYDDIGKTIEIINLDTQRVVAGLHTFLARPNKHDMALGFAGYLLQSNKVRKQVKTISQGTKVLSLSTSRLSNIKLHLPSKQEQEKIASFLTSVDTKIEQLTKQEQLLQQYKKGVMQKIFNQEIRFKADDGSEFCDWEETKLNNFLIERVDYPKNVLPIYSLTIENGIIPKSERYERAFLVKDDYEYKTMKKDDFAFNPMNLRFGALARHKKDLDVMVSKYYNIFYCNEKLNAYFAELYFTNYDSIQYYNKMATGSLEEKKRVHFKEFLKFRFEFPCLEEQNKIANFLYSIDTKIQQTQKQLELSKEFKKTLLQQMFV